MKKLISLTTLMTIFNTLPVFATLENYPFFDIKIVSETCVDALRNYEIELKLLHNTCEKTSDCDGYYLRPHRCALPVVLPKNTDTKKITKSLTKYSQMVQDACRTEWEKAKKCELPSYLAACKKNKCTNALIK